MIVSARRVRSDAYGVQIDLDVADVDRTHGDPAETAIALSANECDAFVEHEQVLEPFFHVTKTPNFAQCLSFPGVIAHIFHSIYAPVTEQWYPSHSTTF